MLKRGTPRATRAQRRDAVRRGYDAISYSYAANDASAATNSMGHPYGSWISELSRHLSSGARVLDLGCGAGIPATKLLVEAGYEVVGVDFSAVQIQRAKGFVQGATFVCADIATWKGPPGGFDAVVAFYSLIHLPVRDQERLFPRIRQWLRGGGYLLAIVGHGHSKGTDDFFGTPMYWEHADTATYLRWMETAGLDPIWHRFEPEGSSGHALVMARATPVPKL